MTALTISIVVILALVVIPIIFVVGLYNGLVRLRNRYKNAFAQIDVQLKRRHDLIPNLVETAKGFMKHERETLEAVIAARNVAHAARQNAVSNVGDAESMTALAQAESGLGGMMGRLLAVSESYPELRSNQNMLQLQEELSSTESKVAFARQAYNDAVMHYNNKIESFPANFIAGMFNFVKATMFEVSDDSERDVVKVEF
ncbi:MAG: LemA family protein [Verrucomicrobiales bacterium]|nr:LemA family protein [Verrucomicrobiales bacterium]